MMKTSEQVTSDRVTATPDPASPGVHNPIHDNQGADAAGYAGALVAGVRSYGWAVHTVVKALGVEWRRTGWADITLNRPVFAGEQVLINATNVPAGVSLEATSTNADGESRVVLSGAAGLGQAPFVAELDPPAIVAAGTPSAPLPRYTLDTIPLHKPLTPQMTRLSSAGAKRLLAEDLKMQDPYYLAADSPVPIHPYFLAARMAPLTRHNFTYGPTIHVRTQIQHLREAHADCELVTGAQIVKAYERKGHWYQVLDGIVSDPHREVARLRHHTIFRPRGT